MLDRICALDISQKNNCPRLPSALTETELWLPNVHTIVYLICTLYYVKDSLHNIS